MDSISLLIGVAVIAFLVWLCVIVPMNMARTRGRSAILWVLVSLLVSPLVSIIVLAAMGPVEEKTLTV